MIALKEEQLIRFLHKASAAEITGFIEKLSRERPHLRDMLIKELKALQNKN
jgi:hypothetical protein